MKQLLVVLVLVFLTISAQAQTITGIWNLAGQHEMAAGFEFKPDSTFRFFYAYGAADRYAEGRWTMKGDTIHLRSRKPAGKDFSVLKQKKAGKGYSIEIQDKNSHLIEHVRCYAFAGGKRQFYESDQHGKIEIPLTSCDTLYLQHPFFPDIASLLKDVHNTNRHFVVGLATHISEVSFKGIDFWLEVDGALHCHPNYFMPMENIRFEKGEK